MSDDESAADHATAVANLISFRMIASMSLAIRDFLQGVPEYVSAYRTADLLTRQLAVILELYEAHASRKDQS